MAEWPFQTFGSPGRPVLVFLHGFLGSKESWEGVARLLADDFYCVLPDLPGHGENRCRLGRWPSLGRWASELATLLERWGWNDVHLVGYSLGGRLALRFAVDFRSRVRTLTLESASPGLSKPSERRARRRLDRERGRELRIGNFDTFLDRWYRQALFGNLDERERQQLIMAARRGGGDQPEKMAQIIEALSPGREPSLWECLPALELPVLLIGGGEDAAYRSILGRMADLLPQARLHLVDGAGHNVHAFFPQEVASILRAFLLGF
ncbi:MAG: 2-succinyl-6-hydroxy-2,4-cyclohexadiene-1-carboxylate synthase [Anaerolineales bacterium]